MVLKFLVVSLYEFPHLTESIVCDWLKKYRSQLGINVPNLQIVICAKGGRPLYLHEEFDKKLRAFFTNMRMGGVAIDRHVFFAILMEFIKSDLTIYDMCNNQITNVWIRSLFSTINISRRSVITSQSTISRLI